MGWLIFLLGLIGFSLLTIVGLLLEIQDILAKLTSKPSMSEVALALKEFYDEVQ